MNIIERIKSRAFLINVGLFILSVILLTFLLSLFLRIYTNHGESLAVPDFRGKTMEEVKKICDDKDLRYEIKDSVYDADKPKLAVIDQNPKPEAKVKRGRRIYLIINEGVAPKIPFPNITEEMGMPSRQAQRLLESAGLKVGTHPEFVPNIANGAVIHCKYNGKIITPGTMIPKGSLIEFVLGDGGKGGGTSTLPSLSGKTLDAARIILRDININIGSIDSTGVKNINTAIIYKQSPLAGKKISQGDIVNVSLKDN